MKKTFEEARFEIITLTADVIVTSLVTTDTGSGNTVSDGN